MHKVLRMRLTSQTYTMTVLILGMDLIMGGYWEWEIYPQKKTIWDLNLKQYYSGPLHTKPLVQWSGTQAMWEALPQGLSTCSNNIASFPGSAQHSTLSLHQVAQSGYSERHVGTRGDSLHFWPTSQPGRTAGLHWGPCLPPPHPTNVWDHLRQSWPALHKWSKDQIMTIVLTMCHLLLEQHQDWFLET